LGERTDSQGTFESVDPEEYFNGINEQMGGRQGDRASVRETRFTGAVLLSRAAYGEFGKSRKPLAFKPRKPLAFTEAREIYFL
jgi:hypothetical protein